MGVDVAAMDGDVLPDVVINALARQGYWLYKNKGGSRFGDVSVASGLTKNTVATIPAGECGLPISTMTAGLIWRSRKDT